MLQTHGSTHKAYECWPHLPKLLLCERKCVHECLGDHGQTAIYVRRLLNVKDELGVLQDVDPKAKRKAVSREISFKKLPMMGVLCSPVCRGVGLSLLLKDCKSASLRTRKG